MSSWRCGFVFGVLLLAAGSTLRAGEAGPPGPDAPPVMPPADTKIDPAKLPPGSVYVLTPDELQKRLDKAFQAGRSKLPPEAPTECRLLKGEVKNGFVLFEAEFDFHADRADAVFALACGQAKVTATKKQDGRTPLLSGDSNGYYVQVEQPGDYTATLYLSVPLSQRPGGGRGLELNLPRSVVTSLDMEFPPGSRAIHINGKNLSDSSLTLNKYALGIMDKLDLSWQGPPADGVQSLRMVQGRVTVRVEGGSTTTEAELVLRAQGEPAAEWTVIAPHDFDVTASAADQSRIKSLTHGDDPAGVAWTVVLKAPSNDELTLTAKPAAGKRPPIGPFLVRGASRQSGVVLVSAAGPDAHPVLHPNADLNLRDSTEDERKADPALFRVYEYAAAPAQPWLVVEAVSAEASLRTHTTYAFNLDHTGRGGALEWQVTATFVVSSSGRTPVDRLEVQLPLECQYVPPGQPDASVTPDNADPQVLHVSLGGAAATPFTFSIKAKYDSDGVPHQAQGEPFPLPRLAPSPLMGIQDGGALIDVTVPPDLELRPPDGAEVKDPHHFTWQTSKTLPNAELSWQPYTPEVRVSSVIDVTFRGRRADVRQELQLHFPRTAPAQLTLRTPAALGGSLQVVGTGGVLIDDPAAAAGTRVLKLLGSGLDQAATLQYSFPVNASPLPPGAKTAAPSVTVPLASVDPAQGGDALVRVWCDSGRLPLPPGGDWSERDIAEVPNVPRLPVLVLTSQRPDAPLTLAFRDSGAAPSVLVDRALFRASLESGLWEIDASFLLRQPADAVLDVELPDSPSVIRLHVELDGKDVDPEAVEETDPDGKPRHLARLRLGGDLFLKPVVLDLKYRLPQRGGFFNTLTPPRLVGDSGQAPTRWRISLPADCVALAPEGGAAMPWTIGLRGPLRLPAPQPAVTGQELEDWFAGKEAAGDAPADSPADAPPFRRDQGAPTLVCWEDAGRPVSVVFFPEGFWMAFCSVPLVTLGLLLFFLARRSYAGGRGAAVLFWLLALPLPPAVAAAWAFHPTIVYAVAFGCEPGAVVLLLILAFQVLMLERYRRRIVFLPNFRRARSGSSLVRTSAHARPAGEPSTVDAPRPSGSSQQPA